MPPSPFPLVRDEAEKLELLRRVPRFDRPRTDDLFGGVVGLVIGGVLLWFGIVLMRLGEELRPIFAWPLVGVGGVILGYALWGPGRRIWAVARAPLRVEVVHLLSDWREETRRSRGVTYKVDICRAWIETEDGPRTEVFAARKLFEELPMDGWGAAYLRGNVLVDFLRVRIRGVTEGRIEM